MAFAVRNAPIGLTPGRVDVMRSKGADSCFDLRQAPGTWAASAHQFDVFESNSHLDSLYRSWDPTLRQRFNHPRGEPVTTPIRPKSPFADMPSLRKRGRPTRARAWAFAAGSLWATSVLAAGGHHALDDAVILEPGMCQVESWLTRSSGNERLLHAGGACRAGAIELGVAAERAHADGGSESGYQVQGKWATEVLPGVNAGLSLTGIWQAHARPRYQATSLVGLASWFPREDMAFHLNLGRDFLQGQADENRAGVSGGMDRPAGLVTHGRALLRSRHPFPARGRALGDQRSLERGPEPSPPAARSGRVQLDARGELAVSGVLTPSVGRPFPALVSAASRACGNTTSVSARWPPSAPARRGNPTAATARA